MQRWGAFSVFDHANYVNVATELLLYDKIAVPTPDEKDWQRWSENGWKPEELSSLVKRLREFELVEEVEWNADRQANWRTAFEEAKSEIDRIGAELQSGIDERVAAAKAQAVALPAEERDRAVKAASWAETRNEVVRHLKGTIPFHHGPIEFYAAYQSRADFDRLHPSEDALKDGVERVNYLVQHRLAIPDVAPEKLLDRVIKVATDQTFRDRRRRFYDWQASLLTRGQDPERIAVELDRLVQEFNAQALAVAEKGRVETVVTVLTVGLGLSAAVTALGPAVGFAVPPLVKGAALLNGFVSAGAAIWRRATGSKDADAAQRVAAPGAMFHQIANDTGFEYRPIPRR